METARAGIVGLILMTALGAANPIFAAEETKPAASETVVSTESTVVAPAPQSLSQDPLEKFNRLVFTFNDNFDYFLLKPFATLYNKIMPHPLNRGIHNVFMNFNNLPTIANDLLQLHWQQALSDAWRLGLNTTIGIGGLFDVAKTMGLEPYSNDFGLTLAHYGYTSSTYLVLPFLGPNTFRDAVGIPVDYYAFSIYPHIQPPEDRYAVIAMSFVDARAQLLKYQSVLDEAAVDKYAFQRNAYLQRRAYKIKQNQQLGQNEEVNTNAIPADNQAMPGMNLGS